jgi:hypothetical protein
MVQVMNELELKCLGYYLVMMMDEPLAMLTSHYYHFGLCCSMASVRSPNHWPYCHCTAVMVQLTTLKNVGRITQLAHQC